MTHVSSPGSSLHRIMALFVTAAMTLSLSVTVTFISAKSASALCIANDFSGRWRSSDSRLSRIDVWPGEDCQLYAKAWSRCEGDASRDCSWSRRANELQSTPDRNFRFFTQGWNNATEVVQLHLKSKSRLAAWDSTDYNSGKRDSFWVQMVKDR
ncbi:hypothetical protein ACFZBM_38715 [Streptomyces lavendulae]|uniref:hypothetical protein n=1 Tax=Streptomyces lavendulae TaxID=1914 RepID=UPI00055AB38D|nr:hypothetical protein [Streptomyces lavendulae]